MPQLLAPDFLRKLHLLIDYAGFENLTHIAAGMGVNESTMRSWTKQRGYIHEGTVSKNGRAPVIKLFCDYLPRLSEQAVTDLLEGPYDDMAAVFIKDTDVSLADLIEEEASFEGVKVIVGHEGHFEPGYSGFSKEKWDSHSDEKAMHSLIFPLPATKPTKLVPIGTYFRFEFPKTRRAKYYLGIQQAPQGWAAFDASPAKEDKIVRLPAQNEQTDKAVLCEDWDAGQSRFTLIQSMRPFPNFIYAVLRDRIPMSRTDISSLAHHVRDIPKVDRTLHAIDIEFFRGAG
ncbi:hypothetical protein [Tateyamaria sp.]|uniref:hypothetical protein n=1 Tax=Tateyamaria sp. TaxID=1929288 RepID=UPI0032A124AE